MPDIPQIDDLSLRDHLVAQHAPRPGWREEFSLDASNVFVFEAITDPVQEHIEREINEHDVVLFMKGTPIFPQCGFFSLVVQVLSHLGVKFMGSEVISDSTLRKAIKAFSDLPTVPQLYVKGEFVGGCDIVREMFETGELAQLLAIRGVPGPPPRMSPVSRKMTPARWKAVDRARPWVRRAALDVLDGDFGDA